MNDGMQYAPIQGQGHEPFKVEIRPFATAIFSTIYKESWQLTTGAITKFDRAGFLIPVLVFVSRDFELGTNVNCEESTVIPVWG